jgi:hypothetical protein|nr:MAG TPA: hypothetical protein [Caudoviricetes sp.]
MNKNVIRPIAYSGKYIDVKGKDYFLAPEVSPGGCQGCDLLGKGECTKALTDYCRQGYILKKVNR